MLDGINGVEKRQRVFRFVYYSVVFSFLFLFFAKIHPIMIFDSDDWGVAMFRRRALPLWGIWNPARILPEVLMPVCSSIGAHILYPLLGDFSWSTTLVYAAVVSGFIVMYLYVMKGVKRAYKELKIKGFSNYDFRSTFGTQLKESGLSSAIVADLMGHADTRMVETVYARTRHEGVMKQLEAVEAINAGITIGL